MSKFTSVLDAVNNHIDTLVEVESLTAADYAHGSDVASALAALAKVYADVRGEEFKPTADSTSIPDMLDEILTIADEAVTGGSSSDPDEH